MAAPAGRPVTRSCPCRRIAGAALVLALVAAAAVVLGGGRLLVADDPLPPRADALVVLAGSTRGERARRTEAVRLLAQARAGQLVLSAPRVNYLGEWIPDLMRRYVERVYGAEQARRTVLCTHDADSTLEEAQALRPCLEARGWRTVVVVTSNYHTRRARRIWRRALKDTSPPIHVFVHGVDDGDFDPQGWWRRRRSAKTFLEEAIKSVWSYAFE
jgi:uncharacterized SAM-binding protein YcdF (DUF218 family)